MENARPHSVMVEVAAQAGFRFKPILLLPITSVCLLATVLLRMAHCRHGHGEFIDSICGYSHCHPTLSKLLAV
jgi:hypothetical protein